MITPNFTQLLDKLTRIDEEECSRLLSAYLSIKAKADRGLVIGLAETIAKETKRPSKPH